MWVNAGEETKHKPVRGKALFVGLGAYDSILVFYPEHEALVPVTSCGDVSGWKSQQISWQG